MWRYAWLFLIAAAGSAQQETVAFDSDTIIRTDTNLVQVHVIAVDKDGRPVTDLRREDFTVEDDRKAQRLTLFSSEGGAAGANGGADSDKAAPSYSVLLLDWVNTQYSYRLQARDLVLDLLKTYRPAQRVALYLLDRNQRLLVDFTADTDLLRNVIERTDLEFGLPEEDARGQFDARSRPMNTNTAAATLDRQNNAFDTLHALEAIAQQLEHVPGRKSLVWLTSGIPWQVGGIDFIPRVETALDKLNKSDVAMYSVNICGMSSMCHSNGETMMEIAERTGGTYFGGRNDIGEGVRLALEDTRVSYTLGFNVPVGAAPGLHEIRVRVKRPGVHLRYRESYWWGA